MHGAQELQALRMICKGLSLYKLDVEEHDVQLPLRRDFWVQLPQGTCGGVPRIGKKRLSILLALLVEPREDCAGHEYLPPHDEPRDSLRQPQGDGLDGTEVLRDVLPHCPIPSRRAPDEQAVPVLQCHREAVYLGLHSILRRPDGITDPLVEPLQLLHGEHVLKALQRHLVAHLLKAVQHLSPHSLGGRIRGDMLRVGRLQLFQTAELMVVVIVAHGGRVQHIVFIARALQFTAQALDLRLDRSVHRFRSLLHKGHIPDRWSALESTKNRIQASAPSCR